MTKVETMWKFPSELDSALWFLFSKNQPSLKVSKNRKSEVFICTKKRMKIFLYFCPEEKLILGEFIFDTCDLFISKLGPTQLSQHTYSISTFRAETKKYFWLYLWCKWRFYLDHFRFYRPLTCLLITTELKVSKSRKKYVVLDFSKNRTKLTILSTEGAQNSEVSLKWELRLLLLHQYPLSSLEDEIAIWLCQRNSNNI